MCDILREIPDSELPFLRDFYKDLACAPYIYGFLNTAIQWKRKAPEKKYITFYAPRGDWRTDGTFISLTQFFSYDLMMFTKQESGDILYECLTQTKVFDYLKHRTLFFAIHRLHIAKVLDAVRDLQIPVDVVNPCDVWWIPKEKAINLKVEIPTEVYLKQLSADDVPIINNYWPHRYEGSEDYLKTMLELSVGYGLFLKENDEIVSWIFKNQYCGLGILQTVDEHKRRGYGSALTKYLSIEIAKEGYHPLGTVLQKNKASQNMFKLCGFEILDQVTFVECKKLL